MSRLYNVFLNQIEIYGWSEESVKIFVELFLREGDSEDMENLLALFLEEPQNSYRAMLLDVIMKSEEKKTAEKLYFNCFEAGELKEGVSTEVFRVLGYMKYEPVKKTLIRYIKSKDYNESKNACLGLLNFDCSEFEDEIIEAVDECFKSSIFNEFVPVLASKVKKKDYREAIFEHGKNLASVDCNAGLITAIALLGEKELFKKILWDEKWEVFDCGTGTGYWSFIGMQILRIPFKELYLDIKQAIEEKGDCPEVIYKLGVIHTLLKNRLDFTIMPFNIDYMSEKFEDIYNTIFETDDMPSLNELVERNIKDNEFVNSFAEIRRFVRRRTM